MSLEERLARLKDLSPAPESVVNTNAYGLNKLEKKWHIDNLDFIYEVISKIGDADNKYLEICKSIIDALQLTILEVDDELDHLEKPSIEQVIASETIKVVNPALFFSRILREAQQRPEIIGRVIKSGISYSNEVSTLLFTPVQYIENAKKYNSAQDKVTEIKALTDTQILRGSHLRVYFRPTVYLIDPQPSENEIERLAKIIERTRGIEIIIKDLSDFENDSKLGNYNPLALITAKYNNRTDLDKLVKEDILNVGRSLLNDISKLANGKIESRYVNAVSVAFSRAQLGLKNLEENLRNYKL